MVRRLLALVLFVTASALLAAGCKCHSCNRCPAPCSSGYIAPVVVPAPARQFYQAPCNGCNQPPLASSQLPLQRGHQPPVIVTPQPPVVAAPQPPVFAERQPTQPPTWQPAPGAADSRPLPPPPGDSDTRAKLNLPEPMAPPTPPEASVPNVREQQSAPDQKLDLATEVPEFTLVYDKIAAGWKPFPDGFKLLKEKGYRTVLDIHLAGDDVSALRTDVESKGLKYTELAITPRSLNRQAVDEFSKALRDAGNQPIFVFDRKRGQLAGALWYLHFRLVEGLPETDARTKAVRLGLNEDTTGENAELWLAINMILRGA